jgi:hypothetical protein
MEEIIYEVVEEDGRFYVQDELGRRCSETRHGYSEEGDALEYAARLTEAKYVDLVDEAACRADALYDEMRDRQMFGEDIY